MNINPAFHPHTLRVVEPAPMSSSQDRGVVGTPIDVATGRGVVPRFMDFDRPETRTCNETSTCNETRTYNGVSGAELSEHAKDIYALCNDKPRREGAGPRAYARAKAVMAVAVWAYIMVKNAFGLLAKPLQSKSYRARRGVQQQSTTPKAPIFWVTPPPSGSEWAARDAEAGYDIRGTSPTWVMRRVQTYRARRRRELEPPMERAYRLGQKTEPATALTAEFIGPPAPRHYKEVEDLHIVWPPIAPPTPPKGCLPRVSDVIVGASADNAPFVDADACERLMPETRAEMDDLVDGYNFAVEQFGEDATFNYLRGLRDVEVEFMDAYVEAYRAHIRKTSPRERAPP